MFTRESGKGLHPDRVTDQFRRPVELHGLPKIRPHDLRHTWATLALGAGVPLEVVSENLGHSTISVTADTYSHITPSMQPDAVAKVTDAFFGW